MAKMTLERTGAYRDAKEMAALIRRFAKTEKPAVELSLWPEDREHIMDMYTMLRYTIRSRGYDASVRVSRKRDRLFLIRKDMTGAEQEAEWLMPNVRKKMLEYLDDAIYIVRSFYASDEPMLEITYNTDTTRAYQALYRAIATNYGDVLQVTRRDGHIYLRRRDMVQPDEIEDADMIDAEDETTEDTDENRWG